MTQRRVVLLFGLSADPPTGLGGHAGIVKWAAESARVPLQGDAPAATVPVDQVWVLPVFRHAFPDKREEMTDFGDRLAMARLAFEHLPGLEGRVRVLDTERTIIEEREAQARRTGTSPGDGWVATVDLVQWLQKHHPGTQFAVVLGADTYRDYLAGKWKGGHTLQTLVPVLAVARTGVRGVPLALGGAPGPVLGPISSSALRASSDPELWRNEVQPAVRAYIEKHGLYRHRHSG